MTWQRESIKACHAVNGHLSHPAELLVARFYRICVSLEGKNPAAIDQSPRLIQFYVLLLFFPCRNAPCGQKFTAAINPKKTPQPLLCGRFQILRQIPLKI